MKMDPKPQIPAAKPQLSSPSSSVQMSQSKYVELLAVIEEIGKDIRPTYAGSKNASERLKKVSVYSNRYTDDVKM
ncbi:Cyclin-dependent kinase 2-associated protein 1 [Exaiptasia diaphana]|nr:Cyclin-dependent kinase 2-associated protein 1 [Exaiptasia diaphana]